MQLTYLLAYLLNTRKIAIPAARRATDDAIMAYINTQRSASKHTNGLPGEGEI